LWFRHLGHHFLKPGDFADIPSARYDTLFKCRAAECLSRWLHKRSKTVEGKGHCGAFPNLCYSVLPYSCWSSKRMLRMKTIHRLDTLSATSLIWRCISNTWRRQYVTDRPNMTVILAQMFRMLEHVIIQFQFPCCCLHMLYWLFICAFRITLQPCCCEVDVSIVDRITALLNPQPLCRRNTKFTSGHMRDVRICIVWWNINYIYAFKNLFWEMPCTMVKYIQNEKFSEVWLPPVSTSLWIYVPHWWLSTCENGSKSLPPVPQNLNKLKIRI